MGTLKISGGLSAEEASDRIYGVERGGFKFVGCSIKGNSNHIHFAAAKRPMPLHIALFNDIPPDNALLFWSGRMLVQNEEASVNIFREVAATTSSLQSHLHHDGSRLEQLTSDAPTTLSRETVVARALSAVGTNTTYAMRDLQIPPLATERWPADGTRIDCSGFVAWCLRIPRQIKHPLYQKVNGGWFETTAVHYDGSHQTGFFSVSDTVRPGTLLVYPDRNGRQGHIGIVVGGTGDSAEGVERIVHCSLSAYNRTGKAIQATSATPWRNRSDSLLLDYEGYS